MLQTSASRVYVDVARFKPSCKMPDPNGRNVHGLCCLPPGYALAIIHSQSAVMELNNNKDSESQTARSDVSTSIEWDSSVNSDMS